jgi:hypothetical protein
MMKRRAEAVLWSAYPISSLSQAGITPFLCWDPPEVDPATKGCVPAKVSADSTVMGGGVS